MLAKSNDLRLQKYQNIDAKYVFMYQRWQEMLDSRTLDMYQYNILNSYVACKELFEVIEKTLSGLLISRHNIDDCKAETKILVAKDEILASRNRPLKITLLRILSCKIDFKNGESENGKKAATSLKALKNQLMTPIRQLEKTYLEYILDSLKDSLDARDNARIEKNISYLISQCIYEGWSTKGLFQLVRYFEGSKCETEKWEAFYNRIIEHPRRQFEVYYSIKLETAPGLGVGNIREIIQSLGLETQIGCEIIETSSDKPKLCSKIASRSTYLKLCVTETDSYAGVLSAINQLNGKLSIAGFYNIISPGIANSPEIIVYDSEWDYAESLKLADIFKTYDYIDSHNGIFEDTKQIFENTAKSEIAAKIGTSFAYTSLSRTALFQETKYISLWIALEALMKTGQYDDIISHIKMVLPEVMCTRYIYRIVRNFSEDCIRCGFSSEESLDVDLHSSDKVELVEKLISIFRDDEKYQTLQQNCSKNSLLLYRCKDIHSLLNSSDEIMDKMMHYTQKIRWHIQRLYRIRNEITHSAFKENRSLVIYIEHLYSYLAQVMSEVVYYVEHKEVESVEEALTTIKENYNTFFEILETGTLSINDILPKGIIELP